MGNSSQTGHFPGIGDAIFDHNWSRSCYGILMTYFALLAADSSFFFYSLYDIPDIDTECASHGSICNVKSP